MIPLVSFLEATMLCQIYVILLDFLQVCLQGLPILFMLSNKTNDTDYLLFALDSKGKNFRHEIDPQYKANRVEAPEDLQKQLPIAISWIHKMGFKCYEEEGV